MVEIEAFNMASLNQRELEQLRLEAGMERTPVSKTAAELANYVEKNMREDRLVTGVPNSENPYKDKSSCLIF